MEVAQMVAWLCFLKRNWFTVILDVENSSLGRALSYNANHRPLNRPQYREPMASLNLQLNADAQQSAHSVTSPISADLPHEALFRLLSEVGLNFEEYHLFVERLGRQPNKVELGMAG